MKVTVDYRIRGGVHTVVSREFRARNAPSLTLSCEPSSPSFCMFPAS